MNEVKNISHGKSKISNSSYNKSYQSHSLNQRVQRMDIMQVSIKRISTLKDPNQILPQ